MSLCQRTMTWQCPQKKGKSALKRQTKRAMRMAVSLRPWVRGLVRGVGVCWKSTQTDAAVIIVMQINGSANCRRQLQSLYNGWPFPHSIHRSICSNEMANKFKSSPAAGNKGSKRNDITTDGTHTEKDINRKFGPFLWWWRTDFGDFVGYA